MALQNRLMQLGYFSSDVDGNYGAATAKAIKLFEKTYGKEQTGIATVSLQKTLFSTSAKPYPGATATPEPEYVQLRPGDKGDRVKVAAAVKELGYFTGDIGGNYLEKTTAAVKLLRRPTARSRPASPPCHCKRRCFQLRQSLSRARPRRLRPSTSASPGNTGNRVKKLQQRLKDLGYFTGNIGGNYLDLTTAAVKRFQKKIGVKQTGIANVALQQRLFADDAPAYKSSAKPTPAPAGETLKMGSTGDRVTALQNRLMELGYLSEDDIALGKYEASTRNAVIDAQLDRGEESDGTADPDPAIHLLRRSVQLPGHGRGRLTALNWRSAGPLTRGPAL